MLSNHADRDHLTGQHGSIDPITASKTTFTKTSQQRRERLIMILSSSGYPFDPGAHACKKKPNFVMILTIQVIYF